MISEEDRALATMLRAAIWALDDAAHAVARGRVTRVQCTELAAGLAALSTAMATRAQRFDQGMEG